MLKASSVALFSKRAPRFDSPFSTALCVPSGFSDSRFETAPELSFSKHVKQCWQSGNPLQMKALGLATNKAFKRDSQRLAVLV